MTAPLPPLLLAVGLVAVALATDQPLVVAAACAGALLLHLAAPPPRRLMLRVAVVSALFVLVLNPFVAVEGDHVLVAGPHFAVLDLEVTSEEVLYGAIAGMRLAVAILATSAFLRLADPDRTQALVSRIAPRSALTVALAARLAPALRRDANGLREALRLRGTAPGSGRRGALRQSSRVVAPLVAASLERGVDISEAMVARGYGAGAMTRLPEPPLAAPERIAVMAGAVTCAAAAALIAGVAPYSVYPVAGPVAAAPGPAVAAVILAAGAVGARALGGRR